MYGFHDAINVVLIILLYLKCEVSIYFVSVSFDVVCPRPGQDRFFEWLT